MTIHLSPKVLTALLIVGVATPALAYAMTTYAITPEPGQLTILSLGLIGLGVARQRARSRSAA